MQRAFSALIAIFLLCVGVAYAQIPGATDRYCNGAPRTDGRGGYLWPNGERMDTYYGPRYPNGVPVIGARGVQFPNQTPNTSGRGQVYPNRVPVNGARGPQYPNGNAIKTPRGYQSSTGVLMAIPPTKIKFRESGWTYTFPVYNGIPNTNYFRVEIELGEVELSFVVNAGKIEEVEAICF